ncbi:MAG: arsenite methyltransferase [Candidatus Pelagisphaera sp.]|jgi:arsenite methyltransferase
MSEIIESSQEGAVRDRYAKAAQSREQALCCPVDYDPQYLKAIPSEVIERDYGCGDPSRYLNPGETVLDLGSGTGKICFIASQVVGAEGQVIGVDMTDDMLDVARRATTEVAENIGYANVSFRKGRIQDLKLDLDDLEQSLSEKPIGDANGFLELEERVERLRSERPMIEDDSIDAIVSNCVLNLVDADKKRLMFTELFRVLKVGGRAIISDIVSDQPVTEKMMQDAELWSGCLSGAMTESDFLEAFEVAGFYGIRFRKFDVEPWRVIDGVVFRSVTIEAFKGASIESEEAVFEAIYQGPFKAIQDEDGQIWERGQRQSIGEAAFERLKASPYSGCFAFLGLTGSDSKRIEYQAVSANSSDCCSGDSCC